VVWLEADREITAILLEHTGECQRRLTVKIMVRGLCFRGYELWELCLVKVGVWRVGMKWKRCGKRG